MVIKNYNDTEVLSDEDIYGEGVFDTMKNMYTDTKHKIGKYADVVLHGRNDYPPKVRNLIKIHGDKRITHITIDRTPVPSVLTSALNAVSLGAFKQRFDKLPYDKLYHLRLDLTLADNTRLAVEKNEVINMYLNPKKIKGGEQRDVIIRESDLTLNKLLEGGKSIQGPKWFGYSASSNNCQDFVLSLLNGSKIGTDQDRQFVKQDTSTLFKDDSFLRKFSNTVTDLGAKVNEITTGYGFHADDSVGTQSVLFNKDKWTVAKATKWLMKHHYDGLEVDEKPNTLRFRQFEPSKKYRYVTQTLPNKIELIIAYKNKLSSSNKMTKYDSDTDSNSSSSDEEGYGKPRSRASGLPKEKHIIKTMKDLDDMIRSHQHVHGGKLSFIDPLKKIIHTIKQGHTPTGTGDLVHIDIGSHNAKHDIEGSGITGGNLALTQLINNYKKREDEDLKKSMKQFYKDRNQEIATLGKKVKALPKHGKPLSGSGFKKGSQEAKEHMARIRALRRK